MKQTALVAMGLLIGLSIGLMFSITSHQSVQAAPISAAATQPQLAVDNHTVYILHDGKLDVYYWSNSLSDNLVKKDVGSLKLLESHKIE